MEAPARPYEFTRIDPTGITQVVDLARLAEAADGAAGSDRAFPGRRAVEALSRLPVGTPVKVGELVRHADGWRFASPRA